MPTWKHHAVTKSKLSSVIKDLQAFSDQHLSPAQRAHAKLLLSNRQSGDARGAVLWVDSSEPFGPGLLPAGTTWKSMPAEEGEADRIFGWAAGFLSGLSLEAALQAKCVATDVNHDEKNRVQIWYPVLPSRSDS